MILTGREILSFRIESVSGPKRTTNLGPLQGSKGENTSVMSRAHGIFSISSSVKKFTKRRRLYRDLQVLEIFKRLVDPRNIMSDTMYEPILHETRYFFVIIDLADIVKIS